MRGVHQATYFTSRKGGDRVTASITSFLEPGCGFGGSCLPKDVTALIGQGKGYGMDLPLLRSVLDINRSQPDEVLHLIGKHHASIKDMPVTVLGIAFKPDTDDVRESPAFPVIRKLREAGAQVTAYDPIARPADHEGLRGVQLATSLASAVENARVIVLVTRWAEFRALPELVRARATPPLVVDGRRMLNPDNFARYEGIGRTVIST
jgi:UDPglucose 6-dehydrogenase/GDP-mannose 6-dehydrogenase